MEDLSNIYISLKGNNPLMLDYGNYKGKLFDLCSAIVVKTSNEQSKGFEMSVLGSELQYIYLIVNIVKEKVFAYICDFLL